MADTPQTLTLTLDETQTPRATLEKTLRNLGVEAMDVVNLRMPGFAEPVERSLAESFEAPKPEIDVEAIIAEDPNQIVAPPEKPKRGWWRR